jgi:hypothetical protein
MAIVVLSPFCVQVADDLRGVLLLSLAFMESLIEQSGKPW